MNVSERAEPLIRSFVAEHPSGWNHSDWTQLLATLDAYGEDVSSPAWVGEALERTRLASVLAGRKIKGLGPKRIEAIVDRFGTLWNARHASASDFASIATIPTRLAEALEDSLSA